jgi:hypothetical protein
MARRKTTSRSTKAAPARRAAPARAASPLHARARRSRRPPSKAAAAGGALTVTEVEALDDLRRELERVSSSPLRWNADPEDVQRSVAHLVLTLVEFIRKLLERQAIRRMEAGTLTPAQTEDLGRALMLLESTLRDMAVRFGIDPEELNLDLGPLGRLM